MPRALPPSPASRTLLGALTPHQRAARIQQTFTEHLRCARPVGRGNSEIRRGCERAERQEIKMRKLGSIEVEGNRDHKPAIGMEVGRAGSPSTPAESLGGGRGRASLACSYRLTGASARLRNASPCSLLQLCCSEFAWTLNCQAPRSQEGAPAGGDTRSEPHHSPLRVLKSLGYRGRLVN